MFDIGFPGDWSSLKKLIWLKAAISGGGASAVWKTVTGTLLHITDAIASPVQALSVAIEPQQSGSGDPSPTNVRPITGWTGARVVDAEELYLFFPNSGTSWEKYGITVDYLGNGKYHIYGTSTSSSYLDTIRTNSFKIPSGTGRKCEFNNSQAGISVRFMNGSSITDTWSNVPLNRVTDGYTAMAGKTTDGFAVMVSSGTTVDLTMQIIFSKNMSVDIPISWQTEAGTVYGGTVDLVSGLLTVDRANVVYDGSSDEGWERYQQGSASAYAMRAQAPNRRESQNEIIAISNYLKGISVSATWGNYDSFISIDFYNDRIITGLRTITTVEDWKTYLSTNNLQVVYELATPVEIQLTPQQIATLKGVNNVWSNSNGETTLIYKAQAS